MKKNLWLLGILVFSMPISPASADEGMWMPHQMKDLDLNALGLQMNPGDLYKKDGTGLMSAVVNLGGGTGGFVSPEGLILTNHHVAFGAIQRASSPENDFIKNGFLAMTRQAEIPALGYTADVLLGYEDVTEKITAGLKPGLTYRQRYEAIEKAKKEVIARAEKGGGDLRTTVASMYSGNQFYLYIFKRIKDVRLVYAPPQDLGNFGGEVDNWMWPRHTCDFSFLRAYVGRDGSGAEYSRENVPYRPAIWLKPALDGFKPGDFTFVMGYPGRTFRNNTLAELRFDLEIMAGRMKAFKDIVAFYEEAGKNDKEVEIRYASKIKGLYNSLKNMQGKQEGMERFGILRRKEEQEKAFRDWAKGRSGGAGEYGAVLDRMAVFMDKYRAHTEKFNLIDSAVNGRLGSTLLSQAYTIFRAGVEFQKPDKERDPDYQDRNLDVIKRGIRLAERGYVLKTDRAFLKHQLNGFLTLPEGRVPAALREIVAAGSGAAVDAYVDGLYDKTILADPERRIELLGLKPAVLLKLGDPLISLAAGLEKELAVLREEGKSLDQEKQDIKMIYEAGLLEEKGGRMAPDANSTIRFTYGPVEGYSPRDAVFFLPQTTLRGVVEKDTGHFPFLVSEKLKTLHAARDFGRYADPRLGDVPACFLNTTNVTGGSSGSPTLNAKGEQLGIIFDMTYESVIGDYYIVPDVQRTISVDIRYVLFITEKFSGASHIIKEMGL